MTIHKIKRINVCINHGYVLYWDFIFNVGLASVLQGFNRKIARMFRKNSNSYKSKKVITFICIKMFRKIDIT